MYSENTQTVEINITPKAIAQVNKLKTENDIPSEHALRVGVKGGGCNGFTYQLGFDCEFTENDTIISHSDIKLVVDAKSLFYLMGCTLDFSDGLNGHGFVFNNPNAQKTCGCGESFTA